MVVMVLHRVMHRVHRHLLAVILFARHARRIIIRQGRRDAGGENGRGRRGDQ
jgi:uncharacterized protein (DUF488 family)